jgi:hypothetical protein
MSAEDYIFEDPSESWERTEVEYNPARVTKFLHRRVCAKCTLGFVAITPQACPECGGWTDESSD